GELVLRDVAGASPMFAASTQKQAVLVTHLLGKRNEVSFALDLPAHEAERLLEGARPDATGARHIRVQVEGEFNLHDKSTTGRGKGCRLVMSDVAPLYLSVGDTLKAQGRVTHCYQNGSE